MKEMAGHKKGRKERKKSRKKERKDWREPGGGNEERKGRREGENKDGTNPRELALWHVFGRNGVVALSTRRRAEVAASRSSER